MAIDKEKNKKRFGEWYEREKDALNARRRKRYAEDAKYRKQVRARSRAYRDKMYADPPTGDPWDDYLLKNDGRIVYRPSVVARIVGKSASTLKLWESKGWIPPVTDYAGEHRFYTKKQIQLIQKLAAYIEKHPLRERYDLRDGFEILLAEIHTKWGY